MVIHFDFYWATDNLLCLYHYSVSCLLYEVILSLLAVIRRNCILRIVASFAEEDSLRLLGHAVILDNLSSTISARTHGI
jgi:hypothetical protein